jgi:hypothetical protein
MCRSGTPTGSPTTPNFFEQQLLETRAREWDQKALALNPFRAVEHGMSVCMYACMYVYRQYH